jgi:hypothetical protein
MMYIKNENPAETAGWRGDGGGKVGELHYREATPLQDIVIGA